MVSEIVNSEYVQTGISECALLKKYITIISRMQMGSQIINKIKF